MAAAGVLRGLSIMTANARFASYETLIVGRRPWSWLHIASGLICGRPAKSEPRTRHHGRGHKRQ